MTETEQSPESERLRGRHRNEIGLGTGMTDLGAEWITDAGSCSLPPWVSGISAMTTTRFITQSFDPHSESASTCGPLRPPTVTVASW